MSRRNARSRERIQDSALAVIQYVEPALAAYIEDRRRRGIPTHGRRWHRGS